ncbi:conjugative transposon protein TraM [Albibacterium indicum]|uniref:conjugative transposon protein TraM n=1 Tax=Albibacterium indicum TaxID=2292082 RepID=UPI000E519164|nr:conjugative transposon protein TraM [Pedobacter indicus]
MKTQQSEETKRRRRFLLILPLLVFPFVTMGFWAMGGGTGTGDFSNHKDRSSLSTELPEAKFNEQEDKDKFSLYEALERKKEEQLKAKKEDVFNSLAFRDSGQEEDSNEILINEKLQAINEELDRQAVDEADVSSFGASNTKNASAADMGADVERLENLMMSFQDTEGEDKEMAQLNVILDKILKIQNPGVSAEQTEQQAFHNADAKQMPQVRVADSTDIHAYQSNMNKHGAGNTIHAVIHETADIVSGSVIKLRLLDTIVVNDVLIPKNDFIYGVASIRDERLNIDIPSLRYKNSILTVSLSAYDLDGLEGLYIPGAITRDATKTGVNDAVQSVQLLTMDNSLSDQAANAGVQAAKGLFGKKVKQIRIKVKAGYELLLRDNNL